MSKREAMTDPWIRLSCAMGKGTGCRLSAADVERMAIDEAIVTAAEVAAERFGYEITSDGQLLPLDAPDEGTQS